MNNKQSSIDNFQQLFAEVKSYFILQKEYVKVDFVEKLSLLLATFIILFVLIVLSMSILLFLFIALAYAIESLVGSLSISFVIIAFSYLILLVVFYSLRKHLVINPIIKLLVRMFLKND